MRKGEFSKMVITKELYNDFIKFLPEYKEMTFSEFYDCWLDIAETIRDEAIKNPLGVKLGSFLGELKLQYLPYKFETLDIKESKELGYKTNHLNINTKGKVAKIKWERRWAVKFNKILQFYAFEPTRKMEIMCKKRIEESPETLRVSRITVGGLSVWRQKLKNK